MSIYRFIGAECSIEGVALLTKLGQSIDLVDSLARDVILGGGAILPESKFAALGLSAAEIENHQTPYLQMAAPPSVAAKLKNARLALHEIREAMSHPVDHPEPVPVPFRSIQIDSN